MKKMLQVCRRWIFIDPGTK